MSRSILFRFRQSEYTGDNRCLPCTALNVTITGILSIVGGYVWAIAVGPYAWVAGTVVFAAGLTTIWLRGYIVPGTPDLTKQYFPDWLLRRFGKGSVIGPTTSGIQTEDAGESVSRDADTTQDPSDDAPAPEEVDAEALLVSAGVVAPCEQRDDLCLDEGFRRGWYDRMQTVRDEEGERDDLARELDEDPEEITFEDHDNGFVARNSSGTLGQWESRGAFVADLAAARELTQWIDDWDERAVSVRSQLLSGLRIFLDSCPDCEGRVVTDTETVESCCSSREILAAHCEDCDARMLEIRHPGAA